MKTKIDIAKLPKFSKASCDNTYRLSNTIYIDNVNGLGATVQHRDIKRRGLMLNISTTNFIKLCNEPIDSDEVAEVVSHIESWGGVACPRLFIDIDSYMAHGHGRCKVVAFDGLSTAVALQKLEITSLDVQFVLLGYGIKNIENLSNFLNWISHGIECMHKGALVRGLLLQTLKAA